MYIDTHHHILPPFYMDAIGKDAIFAGLPSFTWTLEQDLESMDYNGIARAVVSISNPGIALKDGKKAAAIARRCNDYIKQMITDHPDRFDGFAAMPMPDVMAALDEIKYAFDRLNLAGIGLLTNYEGMYLGDPHFDPILAELDARNAVVFVHPTRSPHPPLDSLVPPPLVEFPHDTMWAIASMISRGAFSKYSGIQFIFAHAGGTMLSIGARFQIWKDPHGIAAIDLLKHCWFDLALSATPATVPILINFVGSSQVLFGSDLPFVPEPFLTPMVAYLNTLEIGQPDLFRVIQRDNATELFSSLAKRWTNQV